VVADDSLAPVCARVSLLLQDEKLGEALLEMEQHGRFKKAVEGSEPARAWIARAKDRVKAETTLRALLGWVESHE
jgi:hypothetical protein